MRARIWGGRGSIATPVSETQALRREHVVYRGATRRRDAADPRRGDGRAGARRRPPRGSAGADRSPAHAPARRPCRRSRRVRTDLASARPTCTSGVRRRRSCPSTSGSRRISRLRCSRSTCPRCRRAARSTTPLTRCGGSEAPGSGPTRSSTLVRRSATGSRPMARCSRTSPTMSPRSVWIFERCLRSGSPGSPWRPARTC